MDESLILPILLGEFRDKLTLLQNLVVRDAKFPDAPNKIKVAIGMRRAGKTYFLYQKILKLLEEGVDLSAILYLNFEDDLLSPDEQKLAKLVHAFYSLYPTNHDRKCYLFLMKSKMWRVGLLSFDVCMIPKSRSLLNRLLR